MAEDASAIRRRTLKAALCAQELYNILPPDEKTLFKDQQAQLKNDTNMVRRRPLLAACPFNPGTDCCDRKAPFLSRAFFRFATPHVLNGVQLQARVLQLATSYAPAMVEKFQQIFRDSRTAKLQSQSVTSDPSSLPAASAPAGNASAPPPPPSAPSGDIGAGQPPAGAAHPGGQPLMRQAAPAPAGMQGGSLPPAGMQAGTPPAPVGTPAPRVPTSMPPGAAPGGIAGSGVVPLGGTHPAQPPRPATQPTAPYTSMPQPGQPGAGAAPTGGGVMRTVVQGAAQVAPQGQVPQGYVQQGAPMVSRPPAVPGVPTQMPAAGGGLVAPPPPPRVAVAACRQGFGISG